MAVITVVGAGMMGSALSMPARDNGHEVRLVGTHLDRGIIDSLKESGYHPTLKRQLPDGIKAFQLEEIEQALPGTDVVIGGVSSFGVEWFGEKILPLIPDHVPVLAVTKGLRELENGDLQTFPHYWKELTGGRLSINAIGGPCTSYELADRRNSWVYFCGEDPAILFRLKKLLETDYYHVSTSTDVVGVEAAVAMKNGYALGVSFAIGLQEREFGEGCIQAFNPQAALFGQAAMEMTKFVRFLGGRDESINVGIGDLYVTIYGGRTRKLGILLGRGLSIEDALAELQGVTLESVMITTRAASALRKLHERGLINMDEFPLLRHVDEVINQGRPVNIPWKSFTETAPWS